MIILINPFTVFDDKEAEFLALWDQTSAIFRASPGYLSARLCKALAEQPPGQQAPFTHVNLAEWESARHYAAALGNAALKRLAGDYRNVSTFNPALYQIIREV